MYDAACKGMMAFGGEAAAFVSKVQAMEDDKQLGDEQWLRQFSKYKHPVANKSNRVGELLIAKWVGDICRYETMLRGRHQRMGH